MTTVCDHGERITGHLDSEQSIADLKRENVTSTRHVFTVGL